LNCVNHGEINPKTERPDSACAVAYKYDNPQMVCCFHKGYFDYDRRRWSCCGKASFDDEGCFKGSHRNAVWPTDEA